MKKLNMLNIAAILAAFFIVASNAFAACSSCSGEADWSRSANEFIDWDPTGEEPAAFGIDQAANQAANQPVNQAEPPAQQEMAGRENIMKADEGENYSRIISLQSINATPALVKSGGTTLITAVFALNESGRQNPGETQLSAQAIVKDSLGAEVERLILIGSSANQYFSNWVADVPPGSYWVDILASSRTEAARFNEALKVEVVS